MMKVVASFLVSAALWGASIVILRQLEKQRPIEASMPFEVALDYWLGAICYATPWALSCFTTISAVFIVRALGGGGLIHLPTEGWWIAVSLFAFVIVNDLLKYWVHRIEHMMPFLWAMHSFHHSAQSVTFITGLRMYWFEQVLYDAFFPIIPILFDVPPYLIGLAQLITFLPDGCAHLNVRLSLGRFTTWINNPQWHRIHHSSQPEHFDKNFAPALPVWDIIFGTAWYPAKDEFPATGLASGDKPTSVLEGFLWPFRHHLRRAVTKAPSLS